MKLFRIIGYLGLALLFVVAIAGAIASIVNRDWYGLAVMTAFVGLLAFLEYGLLSAARREKHAEVNVRQSMGWYGESVSAVFRGPVLHTPEGWVLIAGSITSLIFAILAWLVPSWLALNPSRSSAHAALFGLWPVLLFVAYVKFCGPDFQPSRFGLLMMVCATGIPFYLAYR